MTFLHLVPPPSHTNGHLKFIEQTQLFASSDAKDHDDPSSIHRDKYFVNRMPSDPVPSDPEQVVCGLMETRMPPGVLDALLHTRELGLGDLEQRGFKRLATEEQVSHDHGSHDHVSHDHGSHDHVSHDHGSHDHGSHDHGSPHTNRLERAKSSTSDYYSNSSPHSTSSVPLSAENPDSTLYQSPVSIPFMSPLHTDVTQVQELCSKFPEDYSNAQSWQKNSPPHDAAFHLGQNSSFHQPQKLPPQTIGYVYNSKDAASYPALGVTSIRPPLVGNQFESCMPVSSGQETHPTAHLELSGSVIQSSVANSNHDELHDILEQFI